MRRLSSHQAITVDWDGSPCRHLAARIIQQAFRDLASPAGSPCDQESARVFLSGSSMLKHWCAVADLDPAWMVARAATLTTAQGVDCVTNKGHGAKR
jgi:hypothetical protein